jgi:hypothetical protein
MGPRQKYCTKVCLIIILFCVPYNACFIFLLKCFIAHLGKWDIFFGDEKCFNAVTVVSSVMLA